VSWWLYYKFQSVFAFLYRNFQLQWFKNQNILRLHFWQNTKTIKVINKDNKIYPYMGSASLTHCQEPVRYSAFYLHFNFCSLKAGLWIWIRIGSGFSEFVDPDPYWESGSGSRGKKMKKFQWKTALFSYLNKNFLPLKRYKIALTTFWTKFWWITPVFFIWFN
jgi:hypothetical protein